jgi:hypothetical protein
MALNVLPKGDTFQEINEDEFFKACRNGNVGYIEAALKSGIDPSIKGNSGTSISYFV